MEIRFVDDVKSLGHPPNSKYIFVSGKKFHVNFLLPPCLQNLNDSEDNSQTKFTGGRHE